jgi:porin
VHKRLVIYFTIFYYLIFSLQNTEAQTSSDVQEPKRLTGNWSGLRTILSNKGIRFNAVYTGEIIKNLQGGISNNSDYLDVVDLVIDVDLNNLVHWKNANFYTDILGIHGGNPSEYIGDYQGVSNIAAPNSWKVYEIWLQQNFMNKRLSILFGIYDLNSEFDLLKTAGLFLNSSHGMGAEFAQSGENGPSTFPCTALALRTKTQLSEHFCIQTAVLDGVPDEPNNTLSTRCIINKQDGALITSEIAYIIDKEETDYLPWHSKRKQIHRQRRGFGKSGRLFRRSNHLKRRNQSAGHRQKQNRRFPNTTAQQKVYSKFAIGGWYYTSDFNDLNYIGTQECLKHHGNWGIYGLWEKSVFLNKENPLQSLSFFLRFGISDKNINQIDKYFGNGIVYSGIFSQAHHDQLGLAVAAAHNNNTFNNESSINKNEFDNWEIAIEFSYRAEIYEWYSIQPDMQCIINPGFNTALQNAVAFGIRMEICF